MFTRVLNVLRLTLIIRMEVIDQEDGIIAIIKKSANERLLIMITLMVITMLKLL